MLMPLLMFAFGAGLLFVGGDWLVRGATGLAERAGLKAAIAAATIVAIGASAPEIAVAVTASLRGAPAVAAATIAGANVANFLLVVGVAALFAPIVTRTPGARRGALVAWLACITLAALSFLGSTVWMIGAAGLVCAAVYVVILAREASGESLDPELADANRIYEIERTPNTLPITLLMMLAGPALLGIGAHLALAGAQGLAGPAGDATAGAVWLGIAAVLPELGTALAAALRGRTGLILPAVFGGVVFNTFAVGGIAALTVALPLGTPAVQLDIIAMAAAATLGGLIVLIGKPIPRAGGFIALALYVGFLRFVAS